MKYGEIVTHTRYGIGGDLQGVILEWQGPSIALIDMRLFRRFPESNTYIELKGGEALVGPWRLRIIDHPAHLRAYVVVPRTPAGLFWEIVYRLRESLSLTEQYIVLLAGWWGLAYRGDAPSDLSLSQLYPVAWCKKQWRRVFGR